MIINPIAIANNQTKRLKKTDETLAKYNEAWLQEILDKNPDTYPLESIFNESKKIISLGREIKTNAGFIDVLLITSDLQLIVIETKLWKNPEKTRTVIAQVLDYAKELAKWSIDDLDNAIRSSQRIASKDKTLSLSNILMKEFPYKSLTDMLEMIASNLIAGNFQLSIIGDKISPNLMLLADTIQSSPGLNFNLNLIEMKLYAMDEHIIMVPDIVGKTKEVIRGVVKIQYSQEKPNIEVTYSDESNQKNPSKTNKKAFISQCPKDLASILEAYIDIWEAEKNLFIYWGTVGLSIRKQNGIKFITLLDIYPHSISMITSEMLKNIDYPPKAYQEYVAKISKNALIYNNYIQKKRYLKYSELDTEALTTLLESTKRFIEHMQLNAEPVTS